MTPEISSQPTPRLSRFTTSPAFANSLLSLMQDRWDEVSAELRHVQLCSGETLKLDGCVWFPTSTALGLSLDDQSGHAVDVELVGRDGVAGWEERAGGRWTVRVSGSAFGIDAGLFASLRERSPALRRALKERRAERLAALQNAALCGRVHNQEGRMALLLLRLQALSGRSELDLSQEHIAGMLGVQRTTITAVASDLKRRRIIRYSRGRIAVLDEDALAARACACRTLQEGL